MWSIAGLFLWFSISYRHLPPMLRVGGYLVAAAMLCDGYRTRVYRQRKADPPFDAYGSDAYEWAIYYRSELQKDLEFAGGRLAWWSGAVSDAGFYLILCSGLGSLPRNAALLFAAFYLLIIASGVLPKYAKYRKLKWKISDLDALLAGGTEGTEE
jgi:hypothetical protein